MCTRIYRLFNPERDEEFSDYHSPSSSPPSIRRRFRSCFGVFFPPLQGDNNSPTGRAREFRQVMALSLSWFSVRSWFSSRKTKRESDGRLSFSSIESGEFSLESHAGVEGVAQKRSNKNLEDQTDGRKGREDEKTRMEECISCVVLRSPLPPSTSSPSPSLSDPAYPDMDPPPPSLGSSRFSSFRSETGQRGANAPCPMAALRKVISEPEVCLRR